MSEEVKVRDDRERQVATTKLKYGPDWYSKISQKGHKFTKEQARLAALKRHHPDWFDEDGKLIKEEMENGGD